MFVKTLLVCVLAIFVEGCGIINEKENKDSVDNSLKEKVKLLSVDDVTLFGGIPTEDDSFTEITLKTGNNQKDFPWSNVKNETYFPTLKITDVDLDGKNEIIDYCCPYKRVWNRCS